jgi:hypothetical protein
LQSQTDQRRVTTRWWVAASALAFSSCWRIVHLGRGTTFFFDEWDFLLHRNELSLSNTLRAHNGHLSAIPVSIYQLMIRIFGAGSYFPYRFMAGVLHCAIAIVVGVLLRKKCGNLMSLAGVAIVGFMGAGWQNWLWGFQIGMEISVLMGLLAIVVVSKKDTPGAQNLAGVFTAISVLSSGVGLSVVAGVGIAALFYRRKIVLVWLAAQVVFYGLWSLIYGQSQVRSENIGRVPTYVAESASAAIGGIGGWSLPIGGVLAGAALVFTIQSFARHRPGSIEAAALLVTCLTGWILSALSRAHLGEPGASRYVHVGICWLVPIVGIAVGGDLNRGRLREFFTLIVVITATWGSWDIATEAGKVFRQRSTVVLAEISAATQVESPVDSGYQLDQARAPQIQIGALMEFARLYSLPGLGARQIEELPEEARKEVDRVFLEAPATRVAPSVRQPVDWQCATVDANFEELVSPGDGRWFSGVHSVEVRRFASSSFSLVPGMPGEPSQLNFGRDTNGRNWIVRYISAGPIELCRSR